MSRELFILGIETSCDETAASVVDGKGHVLSNVVFSQIDMHNKYGGIVPELASRDHALKIETVVKDAVSKAGLLPKDITHVGVASGPGLLGCLLVGLSFAKAFAMAKNIPVMGVDHVRAHLMASQMDGIYDGNKKPPFPFAGLVVSGGHTSVYLVNSVDDITTLASTVDDAAGEVFDKLARFIGLGYPGGKIISDMARKGNPDAVKFPKPVIKGREKDFSFSGLKTSAINYFRHRKENEKIEDALASFQETVCEILVDKLIGLAKENHVKDVVIGGGVAANYRLRELIAEKGVRNSLNVWLVPVQYCTDNAAMIANYARLLVNEDVNTFTGDMSKITAYSTVRR